MAKTCEFCGQQLPLSKRLLKKTMHTECEQEQHQQVDQYKSLIIGTVDTGTIGNDLHNNLDSIKNAGRFSFQMLHDLNLDIYKQAKDKLLSGDDFSESNRVFMSNLQQLLNLDDTEAEVDFLDQIRHLSFIAEGNLPEIQTTMKLKKGEIAHYEGFAIWKHLKTKRKRVAGERASSVRIAKGLRFRVGGSPGFTQEWQEFVNVDEGKIVITSERILFTGNLKNLNVTLSKIIDTEFFKDAVKINRGTQTPTYLFMDDPTEFFVVLSTILESRQN